MKKILLIIGVVSMISLSCNKAANTNGTTNPASVIENNSGNAETSSTAIVAPSSNFTIAFDGSGNYTTSDANYVNSFPQLQNALQHIASTIGAATSISITSEGLVSSNKVEFDGLEFMPLMKTYGNFNFSPGNNVTTVYGKEGFKSISNTGLYEFVTFFQNKLIENGEILKNEIKDGKDFTIMVTANNEVFINGVAMDMGSEDVWQWKQCVRYYWYLPSTISYTMCAYTLFLDL
jgi:hypothetical protein